MSPGARPLRADAARNHRALVAAARDAIEELGPDVPLEEVARRAGVGASTLYRRFAGRDELVTAVFADYFTAVVEPIVVAAAADPDPARGLAAVLTGVSDAVVGHRTMLALARDHDVFTADLVARFTGPLDALLTRARAAGVVRDDVDAHDLPMLVMMLVTTAAPLGGEADPGRRDRYLVLLLDALDPAARRRPLPALDLPQE